MIVQQAYLQHCMRRCNVFTLKWREVKFAVHESNGAKRRMTHVCGCLDALGGLAERLPQLWYLCWACRR